MNKLLIQDGKNSYYEQVGPGNTSTVKQYNISGREITKNGYVYIYVSNETPNVNVYWDNLHCLSRHSGITHHRGALLQEEGYYPFGLEMKALSTQAAAVTTNKYKFNAGTELENSFDVSYYETFYRNYDPQIGRFTGIDSKSEATQSISPYQFVGNNPISFIDPFGDLKAESMDDIINRLWNSPFGGQWSSSDPGTLYYYGDENTATIFGGLAAFGSQFDFGGSGGGGGSYSGGNNLFNTSGLSGGENHKFNSLILDINTTDIGAALLKALTTFQQIINVTNLPFPEELQNNPSLFSLYFPRTNELRMGNSLSESDMSIFALLENIAHELFHAYQDFMGIKISGSDGDEPDAYIFESLFDRQYQNGIMGEDWWNRIAVGVPSSSADLNFSNAWNNFFKNGYSKVDYTNIYNYFLEGSVDGGQYHGPINVSMGNYLIYGFLPH